MLLIHHQPMGVCSNTWTNLLATVSRPGHSWQALDQKVVHERVTYCSGNSAKQAAS